MAIFVEPAKLHVIGNIAPYQIATDTVPSRSFGPQHPGVEPLNRRVANLVFREAFVEHHDIRVWVAHGALPGPVALSGQSTRSQHRSRSRSSGRGEQST